MYKYWLIAFSLLVMLVLSWAGESVAAEISTSETPDRSRLIILADMGNEPDEEQQMMHMLMYCNEFDLEGLIAVTGTFLYPQKKGPIRPDLFHKLIDGYEKVFPNLQKHDDNWPTPGKLHGLVRKGQWNYGIEDVGEGKSSEGSQLIIESVGRNDPRPINIVINAGSNTLAQALFDYRASHSQEEVDAFCAKLRVYENGAQDNAGAWILKIFPNIHWVRSNYQTYAFMGRGGPYFWKPYPDTFQGQHQWARENIQENHGPLGELYPDRFGGNAFLEGGGTTPWIGLVNRGLYDPDHQTWGGWGGRFTAEKQENVWSRHKNIKKDEKQYTPFYVYTEAADHWTDPDSGIRYDDEMTPVFRWRKVMMEDFKCRMDWCVREYDEANHNPVAVIDGDVSDTIIRNCLFSRSGRLTYCESRSWGSLKQ